MKKSSIIKITAANLPEFLHVGDRGKILGTIENLTSILQHDNILCRYNVISKRNEILIPGTTFSTDNAESAALAIIHSRMKELQMDTSGYADYLLRIGDQNQYNPVLTWIESKPWDKNSRLQEFCNTITVAPKHGVMASLLIRRWLITAVCMALYNGIDSAGCLVLQGKQGLGKTWWVRKLVPEDQLPDVVRTGANINPKDRDSLSQFIRYWIAELGEIGSTFKRADIDSLKAFITDDKDILRRPYGKSDQIYPRRTAMIASVNEKIYLHDQTGNRRFWTIPCLAVDSYHTIDMQQLWAEVLFMVREGETWALTDYEKKLVNNANRDHIQVEPILEMLQDSYNWENESLDPKSATEIAVVLGIKNITQKETRHITNAVLELNGNLREPSDRRRLFVPYRV